MASINMLYIGKFLDGKNKLQRYQISATQIIKQYIRMMQHVGVNICDEIYGCEDVYLFPSKHYFRRDVTHYLLSSYSFWKRAT